MLLPSLLDCVIHLLAPRFLCQMSCKRQASHKHPAALEPCSLTAAIARTSAYAPRVASVPHPI
jgi:hypothetical protein